MIRQTFWDKKGDQHGRYELVRTDASKPPAPLDPALVAAALRRSTRYIAGSNRLFFDFSEAYQREAMNAFQASDPDRMGKNQGIPYNQLSSGWWRFGPDRAAILDFTPSPECPYWMFVLSNYWGESFDYRTHRIHTNARSAPVRDDGSVRLVIAAENPGLPAAEAQWIDTAGHQEGVWQFRWYHLDGLPPCPEPKIVSIASLRNRR